MMKPTKKNYLKKKEGSPNDNNEKPIIVRIKSNSSTQESDSKVRHRSREESDDYIVKDGAVKREQEEELSESELLVGDGTNNKWSFSALIKLQQ